MFFQKLFLSTLLFTTLLFSGECPDETKKSYYKDGKLKTAVEFKNCKRHGSYLWYYPSGKKKIESSYKEGKQIGVNRQWHKNGNLAEETPYNKEGKKHGTGKKWFENGTQSYEIEYRNNKQVKTSEFYETGNLKFFRERTEKGFVTSGAYYTPSGQQCGYIKDGVGEYLVYYKTGRIRHYKWSNGTAKSVGDVLTEEDAEKLIAEIMAKK